MAPVIQRRDSLPWRMVVLLLVNHLLKRVAASPLANCALWRRLVKQPVDHRLCGKVLKSAWLSCVQVDLWRPLELPMVRGYVNELCALEA